MAAFFVPTRFTWKFGGSVVGLLAELECQRKSYTRIDINERKASLSNIS